MTDRELYMPSDTIWFNAWVVKAATKQKAKYSNYLYVELRDAGGFLQKRVRLRTSAPGKFVGYLPLSEKLKSNTYTIVAYTYHMLCTDETLFFKKPIDIITPTDMNNGITLSSLRNRKSIEDSQLVRADSTVVIDFDIPEEGQYAASVTNVSLNPTDSASFITNILPYMPNIYTKGKIPESVASFPYEQGSIVSGTVYGNFFTKKVQKYLDVSLVSISDKHFDKTKTDKNGHFSFDVPDIFSESDTVGYMVQATTKHTIKNNITFDALPFPETLKTFVPGKDHFVHLTKQEIADDEQIIKWATDDKYRNIIMLDEVTVKGHTQMSRTHNAYADKSICIGGENGMNIHSFRDLAPYLGLRIENDEYGMYHFIDPLDMGMSLNTKAKSSQVDVYVDDMELPEYDISMLDGMFPMDIVMRVDKLSSGQTMHLSGRGFKANCVLNIILKNPEELALTDKLSSNFRITKQMACQTQKDFILSKTEYAPPVIYWNPYVSITNAKKASVVFKAPNVSNSIYRVMLEGISDSGTPIHQEKYIQIK